MFSLCHTRCRAPRERSEAPYRVALFMICYSRSFISDLCCCHMPFRDLLPPHVLYARDARDRASACYKDKRYIMTIGLKDARYAGRQPSRAATHAVTGAASRRADGKRQRCEQVAGVRCSVSARGAVAARWRARAFCVNGAQRRGCASSVVTARRLQQWRRAMRSSSATPAVRGCAQRKDMAAPRKEAAKVRGARGAIFRAARATPA